MFKKTLICLALASTVGVTGCNTDGEEGHNDNPDYKINNPDFSGRTYPIFDPLSGDLPLPNDLIFDSEQGDGTFGVEDTKPPVTTALNELSGASTVAPAVIQLNGDIDPSTVKTGETVFLIELTYASGDPVQGLSNQEPPVPSAELYQTSEAAAAALPEYRADVVQLDGDSAIRILPIEPLNPRKRYIAVVTNDVKDVNGDPIVQSPFYGSLTDEEQPLGSEALAPVRALINGLWEPIAGAAGISADKIAISYSFTTSNDEKVLQYIAEPGAWFSDQIKTFVSVSAVQSAMAGEDGASSYAELAPVVGQAVADYPDIPVSETQTLRDVLTAAGVFGGGAPCSDAKNGQDALDCTGVALATQLVDLLPTPIPGVNRSGDDFSIPESSVSPVGLVSALAGQIPGANPGPTTGQGGVLAAQGTVNLPYYLANSAPGVVTDSWRADAGLASGVNDAFSKLSDEPLLAQGDPDTSTAVNYVFPFPEETVEGGVDVPVLALYPQDGEIKGAVIYQHGITTDRSAALTFGTALAAQGYAVIAIDQPLHGIAAFTDEEQQELAVQLLTAGGATADQAAMLTPAVISGDQKTVAGGLGGDIATAASLINTVANAGSTIPGLAPMIDNERHFGLYAKQPSTPAPIDYEGGVGDSGSLFINLTSFLTTRDNSRQSVVDQMNLRASLADPNPATALKLPDAAKPISITANTPVYFAGHSLGTITGAPFVASVNENQVENIIFTTPDGSDSIPSALNDVQAASLLAPGGGVVRMLENSPTFAPRILLGLQQQGLEQGSSSLETYFNVFQAAFDSADPINFTDNLAADTDTKVLLSVINDDQVIPNAADEMVWGMPPLKGSFPVELPDGNEISVMVDSFNAPLAGSLPLSMGVNPDKTLADKKCLVTYDGGTHTTPISAGSDQEKEEDKDKGRVVFASMVTDTIKLYKGLCPGEGQ